MSLESLYFQRDFYYNVSLVEKSIEIIQTSTDSRRIQAFKTLVFKMMKDVVKKNIANYLNLLNTIGSRDIPERDELISDCYVVFDKCVNKFIVHEGYNFYFYFNKSLARNFFREYYKKLRVNNTTSDITEMMLIVNKSFHVKESQGSVDLLLDTLGFTDLEKRICFSKISKQKISDFLKVNDDITNSQYIRALKNIKAKLLQAKENKEI